MLLDYSKLFSVFEECLGSRCLGVPTRDQISQRSCSNLLSKFYFWHLFCSWPPHTLYRQELHNSCAIVFHRFGTFSSFLLTLFAYLCLLQVSWSKPYVRLTQEAFWCPVFISSLLEWCVIRIVSPCNCAVISDSTTPLIIKGKSLNIY